MKPRRRSVTPAAIQICVGPGIVIIVPGTPTTHATRPDRHYLRGALAHAVVGCESYPTTLATDWAHAMMWAVPLNYPKLPGQATISPGADPVVLPDTAGTS